MLSQHIDHLLAQDGIEAIVICSGGDTASSAEPGSERLVRVLAATITLAATAEAQGFDFATRTVLDKYTLIVERHGTEVIGYAVITGHSIRKSIRRLVRRAAKRKKPFPEARTMPPAVAPQPEQARPEPPNFDTAEPRRAV